MTRERQQGGDTGAGGSDVDLVESLTAAVSSYKEAQYTAGDVLYREGDELDALFVIREGLVKLVSYLPNGRSRIVRLHGAGGVIGLDGLVGGVYEQTAIAVNNLSVYKISRPVLIQLRDGNPDVYATLLERLYTHLRFADTWITEFSTGPVRARVARLLGFLGDLEGHADDDEVELLTCEEMADILGVTPESVSRVLAEFKREKLLRPAGGNNDRYKKENGVLQSVADDTDD